MGHYKVFQYIRDVPYWTVNFADRQCIKGILKFRIDIEKDIENGSKEAQCLLLDLDNIIDNLKLNNNDKHILNYLQSGYSNHDSSGDYLSDNVIIAFDMGLDKELVKKRIDRIINMIYEYNQYQWANTYCKLYREWILKKDKRSFLKLTEEKYDSEVYIKYNPTEIRELKNLKKDYILRNMKELENYKVKLHEDIRKFEEKGIKNEEYRQIVKIFIQVSKDINLIKRYLDLKIRKKTRKTVKIVKFDLINEFDELNSKVDNKFWDNILVSQILEIVNERLTPKQKKIFKMYYFKNMTQQEIANELNYEQGNIAHDLKNIRYKIKKIMGI